MNPEPTLIAAPDEHRRSRSDRRRMLLAVIAGGLVLGVGTAVTLAVWNDSEFATGTFSSGQFDLQGSIDGTAFDSSTTAPGKTLTFALDADELSPGATVYAPFAVQLSTESDYAASVTLAEELGGAIGQNLTYSLYEVASFGATCSAATPPSGTPLIADRAASATGTVAAFDLSAAATPTNLCFVVTAGAVPQGATGTVTWEFAGTSGDPLP
ncbi:SipW-dependent-type signal peptide-containing protein [Microbacterium timonense]|uniref:SipW-dependent-type signal peptide-containing protein n=1 Tax=Microbacterium timonense TaxID=2086576 RepID=UPI001F1DF784|nr:SipW-dependent-type signal peptide-containing protein [Microbacterium timonense]